MIIYDIEVNGRTLSKGFDTGTIPSESIFILLFCFITICILVACVFAIICIYGLSNCVTHQDEDDFDQSPIIVPINEENPTFLPVTDPVTFI